jgi:hypothetical protein
VRANTHSKTYNSEKDLFVLCCAVGRGAGQISTCFNIKASAHQNGQTKKKTTHHTGQKKKYATFELHTGVFDISFTSFDLCVVCRRSVSGTRRKKKGRCYVAVWEGRYKLWASGSLLLGGERVLRKNLIKKDFIVRKRNNLGRFFLFDLLNRRWVLDWF